MTHYPSTSSPSHRRPSLLNSYFKPRTQRLEICKGFWKGHSINWMGEWELFIRNIFAVSCYFLSPSERCSEGRSRQSPARISSQLSTRFSLGCSALLCLSVWDSVTWLQQMGLLQFFSPTMLPLLLLKLLLLLEPSPCYVQINPLVLMIVLLHQHSPFVGILEKENNFLFLVCFVDLLITLSYTPAKYTCQLRHFEHFVNITAICNLFKVYLQ